MCNAEGLPKPRKTIFADDKEVMGAQNGMVLIHNYSLNDGVTYKCIVRNILGLDSMFLSYSSLKGKCCVSEILLLLFSRTGLSYTDRIYAWFVCLIYYLIYYLLFFYGVNVNCLLIKSIKDFVLFTYI